jgi:hypothetical protein
MRTLATVNLDCHLRTANGAETASGALPLFLLKLYFRKGSGTKALLVHTIRGGDQLMGTDMYAKSAILA